MAEARYYFIKMPKDFFSLPAVRYIKSLELGGDILLLYLQLLTESTDKGGKLRLTDEIPYTWETLAASVGMPLDSVSEGMKVLTSLGLVKILPDDTIFLPAQEKLTQSEASSTKRVRDKRERDALQKQDGPKGKFDEEKDEKEKREESFCKAKALHCNEEKEKDSEKEKDTESEIEEREKKKEKWASPRPKSNAFIEMLKEEQGY